MVSRDKQNNQVNQIYIHGRHRLLWPQWRVRKGPKTANIALNQLDVYVLGIGRVLVEISPTENQNIENPKVNDLYRYLFTHQQQNWTNCVFDTKCD